MTYPPATPSTVAIPGEDPAVLAVAAGPSDLVISIWPATPGGEIVIALDGELDVNAADRVRVAVTGAARARGCRRLRIDLAEVPFVDSVGLGALAAGLDIARGRQVACQVVNPQPAVRRALDLTSVATPCLAPA